MTTEVTIKVGQNHPVDVVLEEINGNDWVEYFRIEIKPGDEYTNYVYKNRRVVIEEHE